MVHQLKEAIRSVKGKSNLLDRNNMNKKTNAGCVVRQRAVIEGPG